MNSYVTQKCISALYSLVGGKEPIQIRIADAFIYSLSHLDPEKDLEGPMASNFIAISKHFSTRESPEKGAFLASAEALTNEEAQTLAREMVSFCIDGIRD